MALRINIEHNQILNLIHQLPKKEIEKLTITLQSEIESSKSGKSLQKMILDAPTWTDAELDEYQEARAHLNLFASHICRLKPDGKG